MRLPFELHLDVLPNLLDRLEAVIPKAPWAHRARLITDQIRGNRLLGPHLTRENLVALALTQLFDRRSKLRWRFRPAVESDGHYEAFSFVANFMALHDSALEAQRPPLIKRVAASFKNPSDLRALQFEWLLGTHLSRNGFDLEFPEQDGSGCFDLRALRDGIPTEIECKSISSAKGRQIHHVEAAAVHGMIKKAMDSISNRFEGGLLIRIIVPNRLPTAHSARIGIVDRVRSAVLMNSPMLDPDLEVRLVPFDFRKSPFGGMQAPSKDDVTSFLKALGVHDKEVLYMCRPKKGALVFNLESSESDQLIRYLGDTLKDAAERQLSRTEAGLVCARFEDITAAQMQQLGEEAGEPTALRALASRILNQRKETHLVGLCFFSAASDVVNTPQNAIRTGAAYFFRNDDSPKANPTSAAAFTALEDPTAAKSKLFTGNRPLPIPR